MEYLYQGFIEEKYLNDLDPELHQYKDEIGTFEIQTDNTKLIEKGEGTLFIYFQGIEIKYGKEDETGNSAISWLEEAFFPQSSQISLKDKKLPIEHVAKKMGFDHFITFNFPTKLTAFGFNISMNNLLTYLNKRNFTAAISSYSTGATLLSQWFLNTINNNSTTNLEIFCHKIDRVIMAGGLYEPKDLEKKAYNMGKIIIKLPDIIIKNFPLINRKRFFKRGGGTLELYNRVKYLFSIKNIDIFEQIKVENWNAIKTIFKSNPTFKLIFLADTGQRIVMQSGAIKWYKNLKNIFGEQLEGLIAKDVNKSWIEYPTADHVEVKNLWTILSLIGSSINLRNKLNYSLISNKIADEWPKYRFSSMY